MSRIIAIAFILGVFAFAGYSNRGFVEHFRNANTASETSSNKRTAAEKANPSARKSIQKNAKANARD